MKRLEKLAACALIYFSTAASGHTQNIPFAELSDAEAESIIRERARAEDHRKSARIQLLTTRANTTGLERKQLDLGDRKIIMNRVAAPAPESESRNAASSTPPRRTRPKSDAPRRIVAQDGRERQTISLSATVYDRDFTELRWDHGGETFVAYSSVDFNFLRSVTEFEIEGTTYSLFLGIGDETSEGNAVNGIAGQVDPSARPRRERIPRKPDFTPGRVEYAVLTNDSSLLDHDEIFTPIDALHTYYQENERSLKFEFQRREKLRAARERHRAEHPEQPEDTIINFWPVRGNRYDSQPNR